MGNIYCSDGFKKLFDSMDDKITDQKILFSIIENNIDDAAREANIGRLLLEMTAPSSSHAPAGVSVSKVFYDSDAGFQDSPLKHDFITGENGIFSITVYPSAGHAFTESERAAAAFLSKNLFLFAGRARLMNMIQCTPVKDVLTGVSNSAGIIQYGSALYNSSELSSYTAVFLNIRNFNYINKKVGPRQGDGILIKYCRNISEMLSGGERLARLGGDNFLLLIRQENEAEIIGKISHMRIDCETASFSIESRMGIYAIGENDSITDALNCASAAANLAKNPSTGSCVRFTGRMLEKLMREKEISVIFPQALSDREFVVYYQPKVSLTDGSLCGCEALARWLRDGKLVPPMEFIPVLENEGTVCMLDFYMLENVCCQLRKWLDEGIEPVTVSVNFSKQHLNNPKLAEDILCIMRKYEIDSRYIEIELTEMSGYEDYHSLAAFVTRMKEFGVCTSIDDFGTGYSSLNLLKDLNVDIIKLDRSFLQNIENQSACDRIVVKNIVNMVNELDMSVIAEGVETENQVDFLQNVNCSMAQGYLFDKPLPCEEFEQRLSSCRFYKLGQTV